MMKCPTVCDRTFNGVGPLHLICIIRFCIKYYLSSASTRWVHENFKCPSSEYAVKRSFARSYDFLLDVFELINFLVIAKHQKCMASAH